MLQGAAPAWMTYDGVICYNDCYYIPVASPLHQDLLKSIGIIAPHPLTIGLHTTTASPTTLAFSLEHDVATPHSTINSSCLL